LVSVDVAGRQAQHDVLLIAYRGIDFGTVQNEKRLHRRMTEALVAVERTDGY
jgi:hypothetical protein